MAQKKLLNLALFLSGEPEMGFPDRAFMTYTVKAGKAEKRNQTYEIADPDPEQTIQEVWDEAVVEIKKAEAI